MNKFSFITEPQNKIGLLTNLRLSFASFAQMCCNVSCTTHYKTHDTSVSEPRKSHQPG